MLNILKILFLVSSAEADWFKEKRDCARPDFVARFGPTNSKYSFVWLAPLRENDCQTINVKATEEILVANWALSMWNQHSTEKLSIRVFDTCSKNDGYLQGGLAFFQTTLKSETCAKQENHSGDPISIGLAISGDFNANEDFMAVLRSTNFPVLVNKEENALKLNAHHVQTISTVPDIFDYLELAMDLIKNSSNNLFTLIYDDSIITQDLIEKLINMVENSKLKIYETIPLSKMASLHYEKSLHSTDSNILVTLLKNDDFQTLVTKFGKSPAGKIFMKFPLAENFGHLDEYPDFGKRTNQNQIIILHTKNSREILSNEFKVFLVDYINRNYKISSIIRSYLEARFNCEFGAEDLAQACEKLTLQKIQDKIWSNQADILPIVYMVYTFGLFTRSNHRKFDNNLQYTFKKGDPQELAENFMEIINGTVKYSNLQASRLTKNQNGQIDQELLAETSRNSKKVSSNEPQNQSITKFYTDHHSPIKSTCSFIMPQCVRCENTLHLSKKDGVYLQKSADLYVLGLFDLGKIDYRSKKCKKLTLADSQSIIYPLSFTYTIETLRKKYADLNLLDHVHLSNIVIDTCSSERHTVDLVSRLLNADCLSIESVIGSINITIPAYNLVGLVSGQKERLHQITRILFGSSSDHGEKSPIDKPNLLLIGPTADFSPQWSSIGQFDELNTMPDHVTQSRVLVQLLSKNTWEYFTVVISDQDMQNSKSYQVFKNQADTSGLCIGEEIHLNRRQNLDAKKPSTKIVVMFTTAQDTLTYIRSIIDNFRDSKFHYVLVNDAHNFQSLAIQQNLTTEKSIIDNHMLGSVSVQPSLKLEQDFIDFLSKVNPALMPEEWFVEIWENLFECRWPTGNDHHKFSEFTKNCLIDQKLTKINQLSALDRQNLIREAYFINGVETLIFALDAIYKRLCQEQRGLCEEFFEQYRMALNDLARNTPKNDKFTVYNMRPSFNQSGAQLKEVGSWTPKTGFSFSDQILNFDLNGKIVGKSHTISTCRLPECRCHLPHDFFSKPIVEDHQLPSNNDDDSQDDVKILSIDHVDPQNLITNNDNVIGWNRLNDAFGDLIQIGGKWKGEVWSYFALVIASMLLIGTLAVLGLVLIKLLFGVIRGNQSLGVCLLAGVATIFVTSYFFVLDPCATVCRLRYFGHSFAYCICFGVMIAKACQLRNSENLGLNGSISFWNYWLLLFFILAVQLALNLQWILGRNPILKSFIREKESGEVLGYNYRCSWNSDEFIVSQLYVIILLGMATFLAYVSRNVKRNYKETRWLLYTCLICVPIWILWISLYLILPSEYQDRLVTFELILCGTVILCMMFGPKVYILLSYEPIFVEYPAATSILKKYRGARSFDLTSNFKTNPFPNGGTNNSNSVENSFETEDNIYSNNKPLPVFKPNALFSILKNSGSKSPDSSSVNSASSDTAIYQTAIRKKKVGRKVKKDLKDIVTVEIDNVTMTKCDVK